MKASRILSKEGVVLSSVIVFLLLLILFYIPSLNDYWTHSNGNFRDYSLIMFVVFLLLTVAGIYVIVSSDMWVLKWEAKGFGLFMIGAILLFFIPFGNAVELLPGGMDVVGPIQIILLLLGTAICLIGALMLARDGGFFSVWFCGVLFMLILAGHEAFRIVIYTGDYGPLDSFLMYEGLAILITSLVLFVIYELKNLYLYRLIDEALDHKANDRLQESVEVLDKALWLHPRHITALNNKGNILYRMKDYSGARDCYQKALDTDPDYKRAQDNLNIVNKAQGIKEVV